MKIWGNIREIAAAIFRKDSQEITLRPNQSTTYNAARDVQLPPLNANEVLVGESATQSLSNKSLIAPGIKGSIAPEQGKLQLFEAADNGTNKVTIQTPAALSADWSLTLPTSAGTVDQVLRTDGSGVSTWQFVTNNNISGTANIADSKLATISTAGKVSNSATTATSSNTASAIVARDASGDFSAGIITATLNGNATNVTGTVAIANGGTGQTSQQAAMNALAGTQVANRVLRSDGTNTTLSQVALATDVSGTLPVANGGTGITSLGSGVATFLGTPSSANLASAVTDETGSGSLVFGTSPTLSSPQINSSLVVQQIATPSNPSAGFNKLYTKSDGILYKLDSAGNEVAVGSGAGGSGEINAVLNPSAATDTTGWAAGTSHTVAKDSANSPLAPVVSTGFAISSSAAITLGSQTSTSGVYDAITLPSGLQDRKLKVEFFFTTPASSAGTWAVAVYQGSTKLALSTDSSGDTILPAGVTGGKFTAYFDSSSSSGYSVNLVQRTRTSTNTLYITNVIVGPGIQPQGAVVGEWQSYTPTISATTPPTIGSANGKYRRVGQNLEVQARLTVTAAGNGIYSVTIPANLTVDTSAMASSGTDYGIGFGNGYFTTNAGATRAEIVPAYNSNFANKIVLLRYNAAAIASTDIVGATSDIWIAATIPIAEWAGSGTVQLAQNDVEFAASAAGGSEAGWDAAAGVGDTVYGPNGAVVSGALSAQRIKRIRFQTPSQAGDKLFVEVQRNGQWVDLAQIFPHMRQGAAEAGATILPVSGSSTDFDIYFYQYSELSGVTFGAAGAAWPSSTRWRVRKSSAGAAVGFGLYQPGVSAGLVSSSGLAGRANGTVVPTGFVGEKVDWGGLLTTSNITATGQEVGNGTARITLQPGIYLVSYSGDVAGSDSTVQSALVLGTVSGTATITNIGQYFSSVQGDSSGTFYGFTGLNYVIVSSATVIRVVSEVLNGGTLSSCRLIKGAAIRIA